MLGIREYELSVYSKFKERIRFQDGRYCVQPRWKEAHCVIPVNYEWSQRLLFCLFKHFKQEPDLLREYDAMNKEQIRHGIVEIVPDPLMPHPRKLQYNGFWQFTV